MPWWYIVFVTNIVKIVIDMVWKDREHERLGSEIQHN